MLKSQILEKIHSLLDSASYTKNLFSNCLCVFFLSFFIALVLFPIFIKFLNKLHIEQSFREKSEVRELADLHSCKLHTPTMGGLVIIISTILGAMQFVQFTPVVKLLFLQTLTMALIGFIDDGFKVLKKNSKGIPGKLKLCVQLLIAIFTFFSIVAFKNFDVKNIIFPFTSTTIYLPLLRAVFPAL